jgi:hypothetical protein
LLLWIQTPIKLSPKGESNGQERKPWKKTEEGFSNNKIEEKMLI